MEKLITSLRVFVVYAILLGVLYPCAITFLGNVFMKNKADGSLIYKDKVIVGSSLIAEEFKSDKYFYSRFSAVNYNGANSGASDLAPSSKELTTNTAKNITKIRFLNGISENVPLPADMVLASGSGLDPHISIENALLQAKRVAKVRNISEQKVKNLIMQNIDNDFIGIWGKSAVNVLRLNIALDNIYE